MLSDIYQIALFEFNLIHTTVAPTEPQSACKQRLDPLGVSEPLLGYYIPANTLAIYERDFPH